MILAINAGIFSWTSSRPGSEGDVPMKLTCRLRRPAHLDALGGEITRTTSAPLHVDTFVKSPVRSRWLWNTGARGGW